jgi:hypothetical protein
MSKNIKTDEKNRCSILKHFYEAIICVKGRAFCLKVKKYNSLNKLHRCDVN